MKSGEWNTLHFSLVIKELLVKKYRNVLFVAILLTYSYVCCGCSLFKTNIKLDEYITYEYDGVDGYTDLLTGINNDLLISDFAEKIGENKQKEFSELISSFKVVASKDKNLSNGDEISLSVTYDDTYIDYLNINFKQNDLKITIDGLIEGELLDVFEGVNVKVTGIAPFAKAEIVNESTNDYVRSLEYTLDKTDNITKNDVINVKCIMNDDDAHALGYVVLNKEKSFNADKIDSYFFDNSQVDNDTLSLVIDEAKGVVETSTEDSQTRMLYKITGSSNFLFQYNKEWIDSIEVKEVLLLKQQDISVYDNTVPVNKLLIVFKAYVTNADHGNDGYFCFEYDNVMQKADGTLQINHDNPEKRFMCSDDYDKLMEQIFSRNKIEYSNENIEFVNNM